MNVPILLTHLITTYVAWGECFFPVGLAELIILCVRVWRREGAAFGTEDFVAAPESDDALFLVFTVPWNLYPQTLWVTQTGPGQTFVHRETSALWRGLSSESSRTGKSLKRFCATPIKSKSFGAVPQWCFMLRWTSWVFFFFFFF